MSKKIDFVVQGRLTIDFNPTDYYNTLDKNNNFQKYVGGSSANVAIGLSRLNKKVSFVGMVSNDQFGKYVLDVFEKEKIDIKHVAKHPSYKLGLTFTEMLNENKSTILMYRDHVADLELDSSNVDPKLIADSKMFVFSGTALAKNPSRNAVFKSIILSKESKTEVVFDLDYRAYTWKNVEDTSINYLLAAKMSDIIIGSVEEFKLLSDLVIKDLDKDSFEIETLADYWLNYAKIVIIKDGKNGSFLWTKNKKYAVSIVPVKMIKGFGGGDAYASHFLSNYLENPNDLATALKFATAAASYMVKSHSSSDLPTKQVVQQFIEQHKNLELVKELNYAHKK